MLEKKIKTSKNFPRQNFLQLRQITKSKKFSKKLSVLLAKFSGCHWCQWFQVSKFALNKPHTLIPSYTRRHFARKNVFPLSFRLRTLKNVNMRAVAWICVLHESNNLSLGFDALFIGAWVKLMISLVNEKVNAIFTPVSRPFKVALAKCRQTIKSEATRLCHILFSIPRTAQVPYNLTSY